MGNLYSEQITLFQGYAELENGTCLLDVFDARWKPETLDIKKEKIWVGISTFEGLKIQIFFKPETEDLCGARAVDDKNLGILSDEKDRDAYAGRLWDFCREDVIQALDNGCKCQCDMCKQKANDIRGDSVTD